MTEINDLGSRIQKFGRSMTGLGKDAQVLVKEKVFLRDATLDLAQRLKAYKAQTAAWRERQESLADEAGELLTLVEEAKLGAEVVTLLTEAVGSLAEATVDLFDTTAPEDPPRLEPEVIP